MRTGIEQDSNGLFEAVLKEEVAAAMTVTQEKIRARHERLGHAGKTIILGTIPIVSGVKIPSL